MDREEIERKHNLNVKQLEKIKISTQKLNEMLFKPLFILESVKYKKRRYGSFSY